MSRARIVRRHNKNFRRAVLEVVETRVLLTGSFANLAASGPALTNGQALMLMSDGSVMIQGGANAATSTISRLSPQANTGNYTTGVWSNMGDLNEGRLFYTHAMLPDGRVFAVGGEYGKFTNTAEIYNPATDSWSFVDPAPTPPTSVFLSGRVTGASNTTPITITTSSRTSAIANGDTVTISGVAGNTAANNTFTISGLTNNSFVLNGSAGNGAFVNSGTPSWQKTPAVSQFGDDPIVVLDNGQVLCGYFNGTQTYQFNPSAPSGSQWTQTAGSKLHNDRSDEETWVKLPDGSILSYDVFGSFGSTFRAQRYIPATDSWVDASSVNPSSPPSVLSSGQQGSELGPAFLQSDGNVIFFGANGNTAIYNPTTDQWSAGPAEPTKALTITPDMSGNYNVTAGPDQVALVGTDDPGAVLPNGLILIALSPLGPQTPSGGYSFPNASYIYEYNPIAQTFTEVTPGGLSNHNAYQLNMVLLPSGQVLMADEAGPFRVYTEDPATSPQNAWRPTIEGVGDSGGGVFTLRGTQLNGIDEGSTYGDDNESVTNYPIVRFADGGGNVFYGRTFNWSTTDVATGSRPVSTQFTLPSGHSLSDFTSITVIANGIPSTPTPIPLTPDVIAAADQTAVEGASKSFDLGSFLDADGGPWNVDVNWGDGTTHTTFSVASNGPLGTRTHTFAEEGSSTVIVTVTDSTSRSDSASYLVTISDPAVVQDTSVPIFPVEGTAFTSAALATFTDPGGPEPLADYSATINWGDGTATSTGTISGTSGGGAFTVSGGHTYAEESAADHPGSNLYQISITVSHDAAPDALLTTTATVSDPAVMGTGGFTVEATEGVNSGTQTVATFIDPGGAEALGDYSATIDWGDGTATSAGTISGPIGGVYTVTGDHTFAVGLGLPDDFGNSFCGAVPPSYTKAITVTLHHEAATDAVALSSAHISLTPGTAHLAGANLIIVGTTGDEEELKVERAHDLPDNWVSVKLHVKHEHEVQLGTFPLGPGGRVIVAALSGDDKVKVEDNTSVATVLYGGPGDDKLDAGKGPAILVGCEGSDELKGGKAGDLLIGGEDADKLKAGDGDDILVAPIVIDPITLAEDDKFSHLVAILGGGPVATQDDNALDTVDGNGGSDTIYYNFAGAGIKDKLEGKAEIAVDILP